MRVPPWSWTVVPAGDTGSHTDRVGGVCGSGENEIRLGPSCGGPRLESSLAADDCARRGSAVVPWRHLGRVCARRTCECPWSTRERNDCCADLVVRPYH